MNNRKPRRYAQHTVATDWEDGGVTYHGCGAWVPCDSDDVTVYNGGDRIQHARCPHCREDFSVPLHLTRSQP